MSFQPACVAGIFVGSGVPAKRHRGMNVEVDSVAFRRRVEDAVRRVFPHGQTDFKARGTWRDTGGRRTVSEQSVVVEVWAPDSGPASCKRHLARAWQVARTLARTFGQEAVGVIGDDGEGRTVFDFVRARGGAPFKRASGNRKQRQRSG